MILCQIEKGKKLIEQSDLVLKDVELKRAIEHNHQLQHPSQKPQQREAFFRELNKGCKFKNAVRKCYPERYLKDTVKTLLHKAKYVRGGQSNY